MLHQDNGREPGASRLGVRVLLTASVLVVLLRVVPEAWVAEDALITLRTVDNFVSGHGLRWNIDERVQVFSHPLWMFVNAAVYAVTREIPTTLTFVSLVFSVGACFVIARRMVERPVVLLLAFLAPFLLSRSLVLYSTSGFETPLAFFLLAVFALELLPREKKPNVRWGWLSLWVALAGVNRLDHLLIYAPVVLYLCIRSWPDVRWSRIALGASPLALWFLFSFVYFGSFFPNTARAKLGAGVALTDYLREGLAYTSNLLRWDPASGPILAIAFLLTIGAAARSLERPRGGPVDERFARIAALGCGVFLYGAYIVRIGGGFLSGRFWAPPLFGALLVLSLGGADLARGVRSSRSAPTGLVAVGILTLSFVGCLILLGVGSFDGRARILDRSLGHYYLDSELTWSRTSRAQKWWDKGLELRRQAEQSPHPLVTVSGVIGFKGLAAGRNVLMIDPLGLGDPLLSHLQLQDSESWRIGHLKRPIPRGYLHARSTGELDRMDPPLREFYRHLRLVSSGPLLDGKRIRTIIDLHLGRYDHLLEQWESERTSRSPE